MFRKSLMAATIAALCSTGAWAAVSADEAKQLGTTLTAVGAEKAANKDGTIPEYTGAQLPTPAGFEKGGGLRPDPFAGEKPRLVITGKDLAANADKLTAGTQELLKRYPTMRIDVYPTHRPVVLPKRILDNTAKNATGAKLVEDGIGMENALAGIPFPIPKNGNEAIWNHQFRYQGVASKNKYDVWNVDSAGVPTLATTGEIFQEYPIFDPKKTDATKATDTYIQVKLFYSAPARRNGEALMVKDYVQALAQPRRAWQYLPGQRRVKLAPDIAYDTPNPGGAGLSTYDDAFIFNGALDRYDFKLVGKKEMYVPYNNYKLRNVKTAGEATTPNFVNPDQVRWELHRVWVVEATLKAGKRHIYAKRTFYLDEDSWAALASDEYDARGQLFVSGLSFMTYMYDVQATNTDLHMFYNFTTGAYSLTGMNGMYYGTKYVDMAPEIQWSPETLAGSGIR
jgi:Protein of unknown function (DUF1329)